MAQAENAKKLDYTPVTYDDQYLSLIHISEPTSCS